MAKRYQVMVFGKAGCDKCKVLNGRLDTLLAREDWADFEKLYCDLDTADGLVEFCKAECLNPQRVPGFVVRRLDESGRRYEALSNPTHEAVRRECGQALLPHILGMQTDYSGAGRGVISAKMIETVLDSARRGS